MASEPERAGIPLHGMNPERYRKIRQRSGGRVLSTKPSPANRDVELRLIDEAIAAGRCHRISAAEALAYDEAQTSRLPPGQRGFRALMVDESRARAALAAQRSSR